VRFSRSTDSCEGPDPYRLIPGIIGACRDGRWVAVRGVRTKGKVMRLESGYEIGAWGIEAEGEFFEIADGLVEILKIDGLMVEFAAFLREDLPGEVAGSKVVQLNWIVVR
jgi:hypothetical protein